MDANAFNVMMQMVEENLARGEVLVERFCPDRLINARYLSWGTVLARVQLIRSRTKDALHRHMVRHNALSLWQVPSLDVKLMTKDHDLSSQRGPRLEQ